MATYPNRREPQPGRYDRSGQLMVESLSEQPIFSLACPECGAPAANGRICRELYEELLQLETNDPQGAGAVHNLSVLCYVLQHPQGYSNATLNWGIDSLRELVAGKQQAAESAPEEPRPQPGGLFRLFRSKPKAKSRPDYRAARRPRLPNRWGMTIDQVYQPDPYGHPERVRRWARTILGDLDT